MSGIKGGIDENGPPVDTFAFFTNLHFDPPIYVKLYRSRVRLALAITIDNKPYQPRFTGLPEDYYKIMEEIEL